MKKEETGGTTKKKFKKLQNQYNKILIDLFQEHASECIEEALEESPGSFGANIHDILDSALDKLRDAVAKELDIDDETGELEDIDAVALGPGIAVRVGSDDEIDMDEEYEEEGENEDPEDDSEYNETDEDEEDEDD